MNRNRRMPRIGDLIIRKEDNMRYMGLVREIVNDKWGHQRSVFIEWSSCPPREYNQDYGYAGVNIHNCRAQFDVIRDGVNIP